MASVAKALKAYNAKRNFSRTAEPSGKPGAAVKPGGNIFMVQKHAATRLHYDFRLELDGVLKSWAVTRGPSLDPEDKRLAVMTEDHPLDYATFEGTIPKGAYGGGTVMLWDRGTWQPEGDPHEGLKKGKLHFTLHGERMKGEWVLFRLKGKPGEARENWLLRKVEDEYAGEAMALVDTHMTSVATGRGMAEIAGAGPGRNAPKSGVSPKRKSAAMPLPAFRPVQLATLVDTPPVGDSWVHEVKYDGYRALIAVGGGAAKIWTRNENDWTEQFAQIARAATKLKVGSALIDGEVVALDAHGMPSFSALQNAIKAQKPMVFFAFDLLELDGTDLTHLPLTERKARLKPLIEAAGAPFTYAEHVRGRGEDVLAALCAKNYEGIVSKRADGKYSGKRTGSWLKTKCIKRQEFVIGGWKVSEKRHGFSSLLLGYFEGGAFKYAGRVGTGFNGDSLADIAERLDKLKTAKPAFDELPTEARRGARWVKPELVAEIAFSEITPDGSLRHPSFLGLRFDKPAKQVVREVEAHTPETPTPKKKAAEKGDTRAGIKITNPERAVFPDVGVTKMAVVDYYMQLAEPLMAHMANRPLSLVRCPQGRGKYCFFQKHDSGAFHDSVKHVIIKEASSNPEPYLYVEDIQGAVACLQMGTLEFHGWGSHVDDVETPDRIVFDLDPDPSVTFGTVLDAAFDIRDRLKDMGLETWPMLSGGKGVHVILPIKPEGDWVLIKEFARGFAQALAGERPKEFTAALSKAKREGRIFLDYLRNQRGATAIMPYSTRSREGAPVAAPVTWRELRSFDSGHALTVADADELLKRAKRLEAAGWARSDQSLLAAINRGG